MAEEITEQILKDMKRHDKIEKVDDIIQGDHIIQKVIGGWIYWRTHDKAVETNEGVSVSCALAGVFVPEDVSSPASVS